MFRFTIRDVLWLTVVAAVSVAWGLDRNRLASQVQSLKSQVEWVPLVSPPYSGFGGWSDSGSTESPDRSP